MRVVLRKWTPTTNISNIKISRHTFVCHYSKDVSAKFDENRSNLYIPYKFAQSGCILPKIK